MANCNELFKHFNTTIKLAEEQRTMLRETRNKIRNHIRTGLQAKQKGLDPLFQSQGSYIMDTIIRPINDDFDLDDGMYFLGDLKEKDRPTTVDMHKFVMEAIGSYANVKDKDTCIRVQFEKEGFHLDVPIYYKENTNSPELAHKVKNWVLSDPVEFIAWFEEKINSGFQKSFIYEQKNAQVFNQYREWLTDIRKKDMQLRRIVRYLKAWGNYKNNDKNEMPPGIILTILAAENYCIDDRDDVALRDTLISIKGYLERNKFKCPRPTTPVGEDLFSFQSDENKKFFKVALDAFVTSASQAVESENQKEACFKWQEHLGGRFPCQFAKDEIDGAKKHSISPVIGNDSAKSA